MFVSKELLRHDLLLIFLGLVPLFFARYNTLFMKEGGGWGLGIDRKQTDEVVRRWMWEEGHTINIGELNKTIDTGS